MPYSTPTTPEEIRDFVSYFQKTRIMLSAFELGIFSVLSEKKLTSAEVAEIIKADKRGTDRLMNALCALGFLQKESELFSNTQVSSDYLCEEKPGYLSGLMHSVNQWDTWSTLTDAVIAGTSVARRSTSINAREKKWLGSFIEAMHNRAFKQAPDIVKHIDLSGVQRVLDVGGGSGAYSMAFVSAGKNVTATVFDLPNVIKLTKEYVAKSGFEGKIDFAEGDYNSDPFPKGYDLVLLSAIVHINSYEQNARLIEKCADSLNPGGCVVIQDHIMDSSRTQPMAGAIFALNMLVSTEKGDTYTEGEIYEWFKNAGLSDFARIEAGFGNILLVGKRK
jgi:SAM-dependent methyltransferase